MASARWRITKAGILSYRRDAGWTVHILKGNISLQGGWSSRSMWKKKNSAARRLEGRNKIVGGEGRSSGQGKVDKEIAKPSPRTCQTLSEDLDVSDLTLVKKIEGKKSQDCY